MSFDIHNYFTDNFIRINGDNTLDFEDIFQHFIEETGILKDPEMKEMFTKLAKKHLTSLSR